MTEVPDAPIDERIAERRRSVRRDRQLTRRRRTIRVAVALVLLAVLVAVERSPLVGLERIEVVGTERLDPDQVRDAADLELGTSTLRLRLGAVEERVTALPLVRSASARRVDPLTVRVEVTERTPALLARSRAGEVLLDREGVVLGPADGTIDVPAGLLPVTVAGDLPEVGQRPGLDAPLGAAVRVWRELSGPLRAEVDALDADRAAEVGLTLRTGTEVRFGAAERIDEKVRALGAVLEDLGGTSVRRIDVTAPTRPAVEP